MSTEPALPQRVFDTRNHSTTLLSLLRELPADLYAARTIAWQLFLREMRGQYRNSILGYLWLLLPPLLLTGATLLAARSQVLNLGAIEVSATAFVLVGTISWQIFAESINGPIQAMSSARPLLARVAFAREALILAKLLELGLALSIRLLMLVVALLMIGIEVQWSWLLVPVAWAGLILLGLGLGLLLAPLALISDDAGRGIAVLTLAAMFVTPVLYVPAPGSTMATLAGCNPVTGLLELVRALVFAPATAQFQGFVVVVVLALIASLLAWLVVRIAIPYALERVG